MWSVLTTFPQHFCLGLFFGVTVPFKLTISEEISLPPLSSRFTDYHALITGIKSAKMGDELDLTDASTEKNNTSKLQTLFVY